MNTVSPTLRKLLHFWTYQLGLCNDSPSPLEWLAAGVLQQLAIFNRWIIYILHVRYWAIPLHIIPNHPKHLSISLCAKKVSPVPKLFHRFLRKNSRFRVPIFGQFWPYYWDEWKAMIWYISPVPFLPTKHCYITLLAPCSTPNLVFVSLVTLLLEVSILGIPGIYTHVLYTFM